jgi:hypothetical protein
LHRNKHLSQWNTLKKISRFLEVRFYDKNAIFCTLTKKALPNSEMHARRHVDGWTYKRKMYEYWKRTMLKRKRKFEEKLSQVRR